ncbi:uncharacterized protein LOC113635361 [Tachysurus fulvidraco]|uniref:uncharacterized protein LOC113635361 n=1 Tax=Tachysurus fulvidraco TaxID=1234273 RepID=UPI001FEF2B38|nr:uncharacterized protein LOC113635361 [Tachysurus fulvidraco]
MGNSHPGASRRSEEKISSRCGAAGASTMDTTPDQGQKCFKDILDLVLHLSDEEWKAVSRDMEKEVTRLDFASGCTKIVTTVSSAVVGHLLTALSESFGIEAILEANDKLKSNWRKRSASDVSARRSPTEASDVICDLSQRIVTEIKGAMLEAIQSTASQRASSPAGDPISQLDDLSIACTNEICEKILALYQSEVHVIPEGEKTPETSLKSHQEVHGVMKGLEEVVSISRSSSWVTVSSTSDSISTMPEVMTPDFASSAPQAERPLIEQLMSKASQAIVEVLLKTEQKLAASMLPQTSVPASSEADLKFLKELFKSTAMEILQKLFFILVQSLREHLSGASSSNADQSGPEDEQKFLSVAQMLHTDILKKVFTFICDRLQAISEQSRSPMDVCPLSEDTTKVETDILLKTLSSHIPTDLTSAKSLGSTTASSPRESVDLDEVASDIVNKLIGEAAVNIRITATKNLPAAQLSDADAHSSSSSKSSSGISSELQSLSGLEDQKHVQQFTDAETNPSVQNSPYVSQHFFSVVRDRLKAYFTTFSEDAADDKGEDEDPILPISEDGSVHELTKPDFHTENPRPNSPERWAGSSPTSPRPSPAASTLKLLQPEKQTEEEPKRIPKEKKIL